MNKILISLTLCLISSASYAQDPLKTKECQNAPLLKEIKFHERFLPDLKKNKKRATTRRGIRCVRASSRLTATDTDGKKLGRLMVTRAQVIQFNQIDENLAKAENTTVEGLKNGLISIYGPEIQNQNLTAIHFIWFP